MERNETWYNVRLAGTFMTPKPVSFWRPEDAQQWAKEQVENGNRAHAIISEVENGHERFLGYWRREDGQVYYQPQSSLPYPLSFGHGTVEREPWGYGEDTLAQEAA